MLPCQTLISYNTIYLKNIFVVKTKLQHTLNVCSLPCTLRAMTVVLEKTLESPLDSKEIKPVNPEGNQSWMFIVRTDTEAEAPILWPPDMKNWLNGKDPEACEDWRQEEKGMTENEMVRWYHRLNGYEFGKTPGDGDGPGSLECCSPWGHKE